MHIPLKYFKKIIVKDSRDIYRVMQQILRRNKRTIDPGKEHFWVVSLSVICEIINIELVFMGSFRTITMDPPEVFRMPIYKRADKVILIHTHPSGNPNPSEADKNITNRLIQVGIMCAIKVVEHIVMTENDYRSFKDMGLIESLMLSTKFAPSFVYEKTMKKKFAQMKKEFEVMKRMGKKRGELMQKAGLKVGKKRGIRMGVEKGIKLGEKAGLREGEKTGHRKRREKKKRRNSRTNAG